MKFTFFKFPPKKESAFDAIVTAMNNADHSRVQYNEDMCASTSMASGVQSERSVKDICKAGKQGFIIVGCRIANNNDAFGEHEFREIRRHIAAVYSNDIEWMMQNTKSYDKTIIADLLLDHLGIVVANRFVYPNETENVDFCKETNDRILKWVFPQVFHQGRCRLAFSRKSTGFD